MAQERLRAVRGWLLSLWLLVLLMVMVGGITRLTGSGLSIVEWRPVTGALPPIGEAEWREAFEAYQRSPQFVKQNHWMSLADFKQIFFWEYFHRLLGRAIGVITIVPWLYFVLRRAMPRAVALRTFSVLVLGGLQGVLGWWMVKSGLVNEPRVSHYRLAAHLVLAMGVGQWILWQALELLAPRAEGVRAPRGLRVAALGVLPLLLLQLIYGAFMAGTHAGYMAATFPDMNGHYTPGHFFISGSLSTDFFDNPLSIHYLHRALAFLVLAYVSCLVLASWRQRAELRATALFLLLATLGQGLLGVLTVVLHVPLGVAVAHQGGAYVLLGAAVLFVHATFSSSGAPAQRSAAGRDSAALSDAVRAAS
ncbi:MAG: COX15/CtaA family protein [Polyangiales bacterium]